MEKIISGINIIKVKAVKDGLFIYSEEIDASKIPVEWFSWIHFMPNKIENTHDFKNMSGRNPTNPI